jgi:phosphate uptake regulator
MRGWKLRGTIWIAGRNYVTSLPKEWGEKIEREYRSIIEKIQINDKIIITPPFDPFKKLRLQIRADPNNLAELKMKVVSAYLQGYDEVILETASPLRSEIIEKLKHMVPGLNIHTSPDETHYTFTFVIPSTISLPEVIKGTKRLFSEFKEYITKIFKSFPNFNETYKNYILQLEHELDSILFSVMRYFNKSLLYVDLLEKVGISDDRSIIHFFMSFVQLERLGDIHQEIVKNLEEFSKIISPMKLHLDLKPFLSYYENVYEIVQTAIDSLEDPRIGFEIIEGKISEWSSYKNGVLIEEKKAMKETIQSFTDPKIIIYLTILEKYLEAIPDISSNICEQAWNKDNKILEQELLR